MADEMAPELVNRAYALGRSIASYVGEDDHDCSSCPASGSCQIEHLKNLIEDGEYGPEPRYDR